MSQQYYNVVELGKKHDLLIRREKPSIPTTYKYVYRIHARRGQYLFLRCVGEVNTLKEARRFVSEYADEVRGA